MGTFVVVAFRPLVAYLPVGVVVAYLSYPFLAEVACRSYPCPFLVVVHRIVAFLAYLVVAFQSFHPCFVVVLHKVIHR